MRLVDPDDPCLCESGNRWGECCGLSLPLTLRYVPVRLLAPDDTARLACGRGGHCCYEVHVPLSPYDVLRLARQLDISTGEVLADYATLTDEESLELQGSPHCPFLVDNLCAVYESRPDSCRSYPFWRLEIPGQPHPWFVERHTCDGCWHECRNGVTTLGDFSQRNALDEGARMNQVYAGLIQDLVDRDAPAELMEEAIRTVYDSDVIEQNHFAEDASTASRAASASEARFIEVVQLVRRALQGDTD